MDLTTNGVVITDAIKFVQTNRENLIFSKQDKESKESKEPDYDKDQLEEKQENGRKKQLIRFFELVYSVSKYSTV
jgi:hypothetical protein